MIRVAIGGYLTGGAIYHSQCGESIFTHIPGMRVVFPSNALDAAGLLRTAIRCDDPCFSSNTSGSIAKPMVAPPIPAPDYMVPVRQSQSRAAWNRSHRHHLRSGRAQRALQAVAEAGTRTRRKAELIDLRSLNPFDWETIAASVQKTNRAIVAYEDTLSWGYGAEIAARIADQMFEHLDAPVRRVAAMDVYVAYHPDPGKCDPAPDQRLFPGNERAVGVLEAAFSN